MRRKMRVQLPARYALLSWSLLGSTVHRGWQQPTSNGHATTQTCRTAQLNSHSGPLTKNGGRTKRHFQRWCRDCLRTALSGSGEEEAERRAHDAAENAQGSGEFAGAPGGNRIPDPLPRRSPRPRGMTRTCVCCLARGGASRHRGVEEAAPGSIRLRISGRSRGLPCRLLAPRTPRQVGEGQRVVCLPADVQAREPLHRRLCSGRWQRRGRG